MTIDDDQRRAVARWAADSADRVLPLFEAIAPADIRPREAIAAARAFAAGGRRSRELTRIALAAHRAGRDIGDPVGMATARSASLAAATANIHVEGTVGTLEHIVGPASYAALAQELARGGDAAEQEIRTAIERASAPIKDLLARVPPGVSGRTRLSQIQHRLDLALRA
jgi:hypothetical protein